MSQKANVLGVGKKQHDVHADQWWARAFDDTLKGLNTTKNEATGKTEGIAFGAGAQALQLLGGAKWVGQGGLYGNFVRGESLDGTLTPEKKDQRETQSQSRDLRNGKSGSNDVDLTAVAAQDIKRSKRKQRQKEETDECLELVGLDAVQQDPAEVIVEEEYRKPREIPNGTETKEQRRQRKKVKKARRALKDGKSHELPNSGWPDGRRKGKSGKRQ